MRKIKCPHLKLLCTDNNYLALVAIQSLIFLYIQSLPPKLQLHCVILALVGPGSRGHHEVMMCIEIMRYLHKTHDQLIVLHQAGIVLYQVRHMLMISKSGQALAYMSY